MKENALTSFSIPCDIVKPKIYGTKSMHIQDEKFIKKFMILYHELKDSEETRSIDTRIRIVYHHGDITDTICMGEHFTIFVNGQIKEDSPELLKLIKDKIYRNKG
ncbi:hypothetical protein ACX0HA_15020 [Flavobacterium hauense]